MASTTDVEAIRNNSLSIFQLMSTSPRERLFVDPILWTSRHLALLGWEFVDDGFIDVASLPQPPGPPPKKPPNKNHNLQVAHWFVTDTDPSHKKNSLSSLVEGLGMTRRGFDVSFRFNRQVVATMTCSDIYQHYQKVLPRPLPPARIAYINQHELCKWRKGKLINRKLWAGHDDEYVNRRVTPLVKKRYRSLKPAKSREDPYIAAVLVGLAQEQRLKTAGGDIAPDDSDKTSPSSTTSSPRLQTVLLSHPLDEEHLHVYTSRISHELLDRFDFPSRPPPADAQSRLGMTISHQRLALKPIKTLQRRLGLLLRHVASE